MQEPDVTADPMDGMACGLRPAISPRSHLKGDILAAYAQRALHSNGGPMRDDVPQPTPSLTSRRDFLLTTSGTAAAVLAGCAQTQPTSTLEGRGVPATAEDRMSMPGAVPITLRINGKDQALRVDPRTTLLDCLRET